MPFVQTLRCSCEEIKGYQSDTKYKPHLRDSKYKPHVKTVDFSVGTAYKQSDRKTKTSFDRAPPRRQHQGGPGSGRHQRSCGNFLVLPLSSERHLEALPDAAHLIAGARESFRSFVDGALTQDPLGAAFEEVLDQTMSLFFGQIVSGHLLASSSSGWHR